MRTRLCLGPLVLALVALVAACGPAGPVQESGADLDPVRLLGVLPSPADLRGPPAATTDPAGLAEALSGRPDAELAGLVAERGLRAAGVRSWRDPGGGRLVASVSVWRSDLIARGTGTEVADRLLGEPGARAWTPSQTPGARGARVDDAGRREFRLAYAEGPNTLAVHGSGSVDEDAVVRTLRRMVQVADGGAADAG